MSVDASAPLGAGIKLILFDDEFALLAVRGEESCVVLCQGDVELGADLDDFQIARGSGQLRRWPLAVLQDSGCSAKTLTQHDLYAIEEGVEASFSQHTSYDMGVVQRWELRVTGRGDTLELWAGLVIENFDELPQRAQAHYPGGRAEALAVTLPRWSFLDAYERALAYILGQEQDA